jgi:hypothetical protein
MAMKPLAGITQIQDKQWPAASDHQESAERAAHIRRILALTRHRQDRPIRDEHRGALLDTYG